MSAGMSNGEVASAAIEVFEALERLVSDVHAYHPEACTGSEGLTKAEVLLAKYKDKIQWLSQQGG